MKAHTSTFLDAIIAGAYNSKQLVIKFSIGLILVLNVIASLFVFIHKSENKEDMADFSDSLIVWFEIILLLFIVLLIARWIIQSISKQKNKNNAMEKMMRELEFKALRAQMNPHFIFNCMNSIKALIKQEDN